jgi:hypothetical protein
VVILNELLGVVKFVLSIKENVSSLIKVKESIAVLLESAVEAVAVKPGFALLNRLHDFLMLLFHKKNSVLRIVYFLLAFISEALELVLSISHLVDFFDVFLYSLFLIFENLNLLLRQAEVGLYVCLHCGGCGFSDRLFLFRVFLLFLYLLTLYQINALDLNYSASIEFDADFTLCLFVLRSYLRNLALNQD